MPSIVRALARQLKEKSVKTRVGVFGVLRKLMDVAPEAAAAHVAELVPGILTALAVCDRQSCLSSWLQHSHVLAGGL